MSKKTILFGSAGVPHSSRSPSSQDGVARVAELGLGCMEVEFVRRVGMGDATARQVREAAERLGVQLSVHGPYYINLNSKDPAKLAASRERILQAARVGAWCGARNIVFHAAYYHDDAPDQVYARVKQQLAELTAQFRAEGVAVVLRPEVCGQLSEFGTL